MAVRPIYPRGFLVGFEPLEVEASEEGLERALAVRDLLSWLREVEAPRRPQVTPVRRPKSAALKFVEAVMSAKVAPWQAEVFEHLQEINARKVFEVPAHMLLQEASAMTAAVRSVHRPRLQKRACLRCTRIFEVEPGSEERRCEADRRRTA